VWSAAFGSGLSIVLAALLSIALSIALWPAPAWADPEPRASAGERLGEHLTQSPRLLGDTGGARSALEEYGVSLQLFYNNFFGAKVRGGAIPESTHRDSGSYDLLTRIDLEELVRVRGLEVLLHVKGNHGANVNPDVEALSDPIDDADGDHPIYVAQLWAQQGFLDDRMRLRVGYLDQQTILDRNAFANNEDRQFMAAALDNNPVVPLPIGLGVTLLLNPKPWLALTLGTADADNIPSRAGFDTFFDDATSLMFYAEAGVHFELGGPHGPLPGHYRIGAFRDGTERSVFGQTDPATGESLVARGSPGAYLSFDQFVYRERVDSDEGLGLFARFGWVDPDVNAVSLFWSFGFEYRGALPGRGQDGIGLGVHQQRGSDVYRNTVDADFHAETGLELYYRLRLLPWLELTPDLQYIHAPGGRTSAKDAVVVALRTRVTF
jgi:porin